MKYRHSLLEFFDVVFKSYAIILFSDRYLSAGLVFAATFYDPVVGTLGLLGNILTNLFALFLHTDKNYVQAGVFGLNGILVGIGIGLYIPAFSNAIMLLVIVCLITTIFSTLLLSSFTRKRQLPILSVPFVVVTWLLLLSLKAFTGEVPHSALHPFAFTESINLWLKDILPLWSSSLLTAFGTTLFQPTVYSGVLIALAILYTSRISFIAGVCGAFIGTYAVSLFTGNSFDVSSLSSSLNYIIIAIGIGGYFIAPNIAGCLYAIAGVLIGVIVSKGMSAFLDPYSLPVLVAPFNAVLLLLMIPLKSQVLYPTRARLYILPLNKIGTAEANLKWYLEHYGKREKIKYRLPFYGTWFVFQGEFGHHTHKGSQAYAFDFVVLDGESKQHKNFGLALDDYFAFNLPVLAPADGKIIAVQNYVKDNPPGTLNETHNWGNYVIIEHSESEYTEISHFKEASIIVQVGEFVKCGQVLGLCGNSGYSAIPHLHIQRQKGPFLAAETVPLKFSNIIIEHDDKKERVASARLQQGALVSNDDSAL